MIGHWTFDNQLACLSDCSMFGSKMKVRSKDLRRCTCKFCLYLSTTIFMYLIKQYIRLLDVIATWYIPHFFTIGM